VTLDLGVEGLPVTRAVLEVTSPQFQRAVGVEASPNGKDWTYLGKSTISRWTGEDFTEETLRMYFPETTRRYLRIQIYNRDDQPIQSGRVRLEGLVRMITFLAPVGGAYWLYYGNAKARAPGYDLPMLLSRRERTTETNWTLGPAQANPAYRPPAPPKRPWSEQHPAILYTVLGGAVLALGIATFRFAARLKPTS
jgi:hypothetical protein